MLAFIVAMDQNNAIGFENQMPWYLPNDFKYFKTKTTGHTIVMGRKTFESIGRVLPNRKHIVLSRHSDDFPEEVEVVRDVEEIIHRFKDAEEEVFIIGGGHIFETCMPYADRLYVTRIEETFAGDVYFPTIDQAEWEETSSEKGLKDERNPYDYYFIQYDRK